MVMSAQPDGPYAPEAAPPSRAYENIFPKRIYIATQGYVVRLCKEASAYSIKNGVMHFARRAAALAKLAELKQHAAAPALLAQLRKLLPAHSPAAVPNMAVTEEVDDVEQALRDYENLSREQQEKVASSLALLWDSFIDVFTGVSSFQAASQIAHEGYIGKLEKAARRMEVARGTDVAFHYVSVELMRLYLAFLQAESGHPKAILLATTVAPLIDLGHRMNARQDPAWA